jgi:hypothetical protein
MVTLYLTPDFSPAPYRSADRGTRNTVSPPSTVTRRGRKNVLSYTPPPVAYALGWRIPHSFARPLPELARRPRARDSIRDPDGLARARRRFRSRKATLLATQGYAFGRKATVSRRKVTVSGNSGPGACRICQPPSGRRPAASDAPVPLRKALRPRRGCATSRFTESLPGGGRVLARSKPAFGGSAPAEQPDGKWEDNGYSTTEQSWDRA